MMITLRSFKSWPASVAVQLAFFVLLAIALRCATFGDLNRHADETFYFLVGQRMLDGALPYVDVWDRKPLGLFLIYGLLAAISRSVICYQLAACLVAALTATIVARLVAFWSNERGAWLAAITYLFMVGPFEGATGQSPDFYNPLIAGAALLLVHDLAQRARGKVGWRSWAAMALCGLAITIKQTTAFESAFFGCWLLYGLHRAGVTWVTLARVALQCCAIGAAPTIAISLYYMAADHWPEFWHAMVISNLAKTREGGAAWRVLSIAVKSGPFLACSILGLFQPTIERAGRIFVGVWIAAALVGFVAVPNVYGHYFLPVLVPTAIAAGLMFGHMRFGLVAAFATAIYSTIWYDPFDRAWTRESNRAMREMTALIRKHDSGGGLLVFDGPVYLYALADKPFLSPLVFPQHLNHQIEYNVSHLTTNSQIDRIVARRPGVIVMSQLPRSHPVNRYARSRIEVYTRNHCRKVKTEIVHAGQFQDNFIIYGDCRR